MGGEINSNQPSKAYGFGSGLRKRLEMMAAAKKKNNQGELLNTAGQIAEKSIKVEAKSEGKPKPATAYENGANVKEMIVRTGAILTDPTGKTAEAIVEEAEKNQTKIDEEKRKKDEEKYGGTPTLPEIIIHGIGDLGDVELNRRELLFRKPKEGAQAVIEELGPTFLPWPLSTIAKLLGVFNCGKKKK